LVLVLVLRSRCVASDRPVVVWRVVALTAVRLWVVRGS